MALALLDGWRYTRVVSLVGKTLAVHIPAGSVPDIVSVSEPFFPETALRAQPWTDTAAHCIQEILWAVMRPKCEARGGAGRYELKWQACAWFDLCSQSD